MTYVHSGSVLFQKQRVLCAEHAQTKSAPKPLQNSLHGKRALDYDILALTETHDKGNLHPNKHFITGDVAPVGDPYAGVAMIFFGQCSEMCHAHRQPRGAYSICYDQGVTVQPVRGVCICAPRWKTKPHIIRHFR